MKSGFRRPVAAMSWIINLVLAIWLLPPHNPLFADDAGMRLNDRSPIYAAASQKALDLTTEVTLEAWVKADKMSSAGGRILDKTMPGTQEGYMLDTHPGNSLRLLNATGMCRYDAQLPADQWTHVVGVFSVPQANHEAVRQRERSGSGDDRGFTPMRSARHRCASVPTRLVTIAFTAGSGARHLRPGVTARKYSTLPGGEPRPRSRCAG